jgi:hypothetical protein
VNKFCARLEEFTSTTHKQVMHQCENCQFKEMGESYQKQSDILSIVKKLCAGNVVGIETMQVSLQGKNLLYTFTLFVNQNL